MVACPGPPPRRTALDYATLVRRAEELWHEERWDECGLAFEELLALRPAAPDASEHAYGALLCRNNSFSSRWDPMERTPAPEQPRALTEAERDLDLAMRRFECLAPSSEDWETVLYRRGRMQYEAGNLAEAAAIFGEMVRRESNGGLIFYAANLYLDALNLLEEQRGDGVCGAALRAAAEEFDRARLFSDDITRPLSTA